MDADFEEEREAFCRRHCGEFEDTEENKLVYTDIFSRYTALVERCIEAKLTASVPGFSMGEFMAMLDSRKVSGRWITNGARYACMPACVQAGRRGVEGGRGRVTARARVQGRERGMHACSIPCSVACTCMHAYAWD
eukprot:363050-Chlamydomonas_euryale.AAC.2